jgi:hypothetical protein
MKFFSFWAAAVAVCLFGVWVVDGFLEMNEEEIFYTEANASYYIESKAYNPNNALLVGLTLIKSAAAKGAGKFLLVKIPSFPFENAIKIPFFFFFFFFFLSFPAKPRESVKCCSLFSHVLLLILL